MNDELIDEFWNVAGVRVERKLIGGFLCRLNCSEANQWHEHITKSPEFKALREAEAKLDQAESEEHGDIFAASLAAGNAMDALYEVGKKWFQEASVRWAAEAAARRSENEQRLRQ